MGMDARRTTGHDSTDFPLDVSLEDLLREQMVSLEDKVRIQLEEKALGWVEEECKKRLETLRERIREEIQKEVEGWVERELRRRMDEFRRRNEMI